MDMSQMPQMLRDMADFIEERLERDREADEMFEFMGKFAHRLPAKVEAVDVPKPVVTGAPIAVLPADEPVLPTSDLDINIPASMKAQF